MTCRRPPEISPIPVLCPERVICAGGENTMFSSGKWRSGQRRLTQAVRQRHTYSVQPHDMTNSVSGQFQTSGHILHALFRDPAVEEIRRLMLRCPAQVHLPVHGIGSKVNTSQHRPVTVQNIVSLPVHGIGSKVHTSRHRPVAVQKHGFTARARHWQQGKH
ncbi:hypothetical protein J6590_058241 [Homalodisca vitripennis]|nr:hypothetical protein J6590_058241 [Homalodisca vitripennis]